MAATIIGPITEPFPKPVYPPMVLTKKAWADDWEVRLDLELVEATLATPAHDLSRAQVRARYGPAVKQPWEAAYVARASRFLAAGTWLRVIVVGDSGPAVLWTGRVGGETRDVFGSEGGRRGRQSWVAYGPMQILRKIHVSESRWWVDGAEKLLGWIPSANDRDGRNCLVGNRSDDKHDGCYLYGGTSVWTHHDYLEYVLDRFVDESDDDGPAWTLGGQAELLKDFSENIPFGTTQPVSEILSKLIPPRFGVDYTICDTDDGFEIRVHALSAREVSFGGKTLPKNPLTVEIKTGTTRDNLRTRVVETADHCYGKIRVLGAQAVCCCSLAGSRYWDERIAGSLAPKWHDDLATTYKNGTGVVADPPQEHDAVRDLDLFRPVYQHYGAADDWDFQTVDGIPQAAPYLDAAGQLNPKLAADYQQTVRETLTWLPLWEGFDYALDPPADHNPAGWTPELRPVACWILAEPWGTFPDPETDHSQSCEAAHIGVAAAKTDWGVWLSASPNHRLAMNHWFPAKATERPPVFDYDNLVATIAFRSDQRLRLEYELPDAAPSDGVLDIEVPDAEFWYLAPHTIVDVNPEPWEIDKGAVREVTESGDEPRILRNDVDRLALVMAGAIGRYYSSRLRGEIVIKGLVPWGELLGQILTVIEEAGDTHEVQAPITCVHWSAGDKPQTTISTGFAQ